MGMKCEWEIWVTCNLLILTVIYNEIAVHSNVVLDMEPDVHAEKRHTREINDGDELMTHISRPVGLASTASAC